jgi:ABC-2 type transport system permease protein
MRSLWLVLKHDVGVTLRQRSFWIIAMLMPLVLVGLQAFLFAKTTEMAADSQAASQQEESQANGAAGPMAIGLLDPAGLIAQMPPGLPDDTFVPFADEAAARAALDKGEVVQVVSIPADYLADGNVTVYARNYQIMSSGQGMGFGYGSDNEWMLGYLLNYNLAGDDELLTALRNPTPGHLAQMHALNPPKPASTANQELAELMARLVPYVLYFLLLMGSSYLMRSVVTEKENRTAEVLLLSVPPRQLMLGKILAMSAVLLIQMAVWAVGGVLALNLGADLLRLARFDFPPGFLAWAALFLVLGYLLYASIMAAAGAIANNNREGGQVTWLLVIPLMPTLIFGPLLIENPDSPLVLFLSLFPFTAPSAMVTRLAVTDVPVWELLLSLVLLAGTTYGAIVLSARFFRAGNLLSTEAFTWKRLATAWRRKEA